MNVWTQPILEISLKNILSNFRKMQKIAKGAEVAAVVKDDAYGLGAAEVAPYLHQKGGCCTFFVAHAAEGAALAPLIPEAEIFVLQGVGADSLPWFKEYPTLIPVINSPQMWSFWQKSGLKKHKAALQVETGLNRLGFRLNEVAALSAKERESFCLLMSHLACADEKGHFLNTQQLENFLALKKQYFPKTKTSLSASDGAFLGGDFLQNLIRPGAALYGINPTPYQKNQMKNVLCLKAPLLQVADLKKGEYVGYGATYQAPKNGHLGIVSIGYGDGLPRVLSNKGKVFFLKNGKPRVAPIIGRVCMDNIMVDLSAFKDIEVGETAYLIADFYTLDDMALAADTIAYELVSRLGKNRRFNRKYIR